MDFNEHPLIPLLRAYGDRSGSRKSPTHLMPSKAARLADKVGNGPLCVLKFVLGSTISEFVLTSCAYGLCHEILRNRCSFSQAGQSLGPAVVEEAARPALSVLSYAYSLSAAETHRALLQCREQGATQLESACRAIENLYTE